VLLRFANNLREVDARLNERITPATIASIVQAIPDTWLAAEPGFADASALRAAYTRVLSERLAAPREFLEEAIRARALHV
jgi:hypothetical protein